MGTQTWQSMLGIDAPDGQVHYLGEAGRTTTEVPRVTDEYAEQSQPDSDQRRGGVVGTPSTVTVPNTKDSETDHDGYMGRGPGPKVVHGDWDEDARA